jgi:hypothetical protein
MKLDDIGREILENVKEVRKDLEFLFWQNIKSPNVEKNLLKLSNNYKNIQEDYLQIISQSLFIVMVNIDNYMNLSEEKIIFTYNKLDLNEQEYYKIIRLTCQLIIKELELPSNTNMFRLNERRIKFNTEELINGLEEREKLRLFGMPLIINDKEKHLRKLYGFTEFREVKR